ncbi:hypothetical protein WEN_03095 [Mycoplasma wenyonii str. Massachusetts]|uniref:Uncharacterized protein n=1 Tax=Mycoplasma wenyonii (strain Massachusetts) TaxID=1197325 RepID=I6ZJM2_MYCWM|nr:hypothetical protein [Mycoplasma wenyonii]AFN65400.1 hypothetical protein WEN_03095 [Mycoplasma wenyonii str. Massachusetts]
MAFTTKKLISFLTAIASAIAPVISTLITNHLSNSPDLKVSFYLNPMESSINSNPMKRRNSDKDYVKVLQAKIEKELFGESKEKVRRKRETKDWKSYSFELPEPVRQAQDAECKLVTTNENKKMFKCTGPKEGPLSSMIFDFTTTK